MSRRLLLAVLFVVTTLPSSALAQGEGELEASVVFFELYVRGQKDTKTAEYVNAVQKDIVRHRKYSLLARKDAAAKLESIMVTPGARVTDERLKAIEKLVAEGDKLIYTSQVQKAIKLLREAKSQLREIVENITLNAKVRKDYFTTQMLLVRSYMENGNAAKAREIMTEIVRQFEDEYPVTTDNYHPKVVDAYKDVFRSMKDQRNAALTITTNPPGCTVYINGRAMRQKTPYTYKGLYSGTLHIQVRKGDLQSMVRKISVKSNASEKVDIDLEYESAMSFNDRQFGLTFSNSKSAKTHMMNYAARLGAFLQVDFVVLVGVRQTGDGPVLSGYQFDVKNRKLIRETNFKIKANVVSQRRITQMSAFIADVKVDPTTEITYKPWYTNWIGWTLIGVGVVSGSIAGVFYGKFLEHKDNAEDKTFGGDNEEQANLGNTAQTNAGIFLGLAGASIVGGALVFALVKFKDDSLDKTSALELPTFVPAPFVVPGGGGVGATIRF